MGTGCISNGVQSLACPLPSSRCCIGQDFDARLQRIARRRHRSEKAPLSQSSLSVLIGEAFRAGLSARCAMAPPEGVRMRVWRNPPRSRRVGRGATGNPSHERRSRIAMASDAPRYAGGAESFQTPFRSTSPGSSGGARWYDADSKPVLRDCTSAMCLRAHGSRECTAARQAIEHLPQHASRTPLTWSNGRDQVCVPPLHDPPHAPVAAAVRSARAAHASTSMRLRMQASERPTTWPIGR
jgi:hypothetical protein